MVEQRGGGARTTSPVAIEGAGLRRGLCTTKELTRVALPPSLARNLVTIMGCQACSVPARRMPEEPSDRQPGRGLRAAAARLARGGRRLGGRVAPTYPGARRDPG